ncbi:SMP-30/Gluconolactonase/LRE-like region [Phytophthora cactorum]|nr:SMP-30/Gluconolactonase/LRE-like region [Phytophthora cactorum]
MSLISVDLHALATGGADYLASLYAFNESNPGIALLSYDSSFADVLSTNATARKIADLDWQAFHEGGVYNKEDNSLYVSSNYYPAPGLAMANGGSTYYPPGSDQSTTPPMQVWCDQGDLEAYAKLLAVNVNTNESEPLLIGYNGRNFSGLNDVRQHPETGDLWFTDPEYGYIQNFRAEPKLPRHIYRFEPSTGVVQVLDDGFTLYVSDTGAQESDLDLSRPATIYAYDIVDNKRIDNKRLFGFADSGIPDGVHTDTDGNVWAGCGDGVHIWNPEGILVGKIYLGETSNNFAFAPGKVFVFANARAWVIEGINALGREVCKDFGVDSDPRCNTTSPIQA